MRTRIFGVLLAASCVVGISACDDSPTEPTDEIVFDAQLSPANEVPPVTNAEASGSGSVVITLDVNRNASGTITSATADFAVTLTNFPPGTALTMSHIHSGSAGANGPIVVDTGLTAGQVTLATGSGSYSRTGIAVATATLAQDIVNNPSNYYFNVHSTLNGSGMARGQLVRR